MAGQQIVKTIQDKAIEILSRRPEGVRFMELHRAVDEALPDANSNTVFTVISEIGKRCASRGIIKPSRGLYKLANGHDASLASEETEPIIQSGGKKIAEHEFYKSFSEWLKNELEEANVVEDLGGAGLRDKWGTPDVVGMNKPSIDDVYKFPAEVVSAELKIDASQTVVAFGQAVAYRLFSHKTYMVMPTTLAREERDRLEALCMLFGVGLVLFNLDVKNPSYDIRLRAQRHTPDMYYINQFASRLKTYDQNMYERLFRQ